MKKLPKSKAGLALIAAAAVGMCVPAYAAPGDYRRGGSSVHRSSANHAPQRHHHAPRHNDRDRGGSSGLGLVLGIAALGALIVASHANSAPEPVAVYTPPQPRPYYAPVPQQVPPPPSTTAPRSDYWYFCPSANLYYPYAQQCSVPWVAVPPAPPVPHAPPGP